MENGCEVHEEIEGRGESTDNPEGEIDQVINKGNGVVDTETRDLSIYHVETSESSSQKLDCLEGQGVESSEENVNVLKNNDKESENKISESCIQNATQKVGGTDEEESRENNLESVGSNVVESLCLADHSKALISTNDGSGDGLSSIQERANIHLNLHIDESPRIKVTEMDQVDKGELSTYENNVSHEPGTNHLDTKATSDLEKSAFEGGKSSGKGSRSIQERLTIHLDMDVDESSERKGTKVDKVDNVELNEFEKSVNKNPGINFQVNLETSLVDKSSFEGDVFPSNTLEIKDDQRSDEILIEKFSHCDLNKICLVNFAKKPYKAVNNFLKGCKWAPDGSTLLATSEDYHLRLFDLPHSLYGKTFWDKSDSILEIPVSLDVVEGGSIRDFAWFPKMSSLDPSTCRFICTSSGAPIHLWDSVNGGLRATYSGYDYADEVTSAYSVAFSIAGEKIFGGYKHEVKIFQTDVPGRICTSINIKKLSNHYNRGIVSCIQENPELRSLIAVGTYQRHIGLYTTKGDFVCSLIGHKGGITHLRFSQDGSKLYSGARKDGEILCWDLRKPGKVLYKMTRSVETNQRIYFDFDAKEDHLVSGGTDGIVRFWEVSSCTLPSSGKELNPCATIKAHEDCISSISVNSKYPVMATGSGQRLWLEFNSDVEDETLFKPSKLMKKEVNIKLWWLGKCKK